MTPTKTKRTITPEGQAAANRIKEFRQNVDNGATSKEARAIVREIESGPVANSTAQTTQNTPITSATLAPTATPTLGSTPTETQGAALAAEAQDTVDQYTKNLQDKATTLETPKNTALQDYIAGLTSQKGINQLTSEAYAQKGGVDEITPELNDINDQIRREQLSLRRATEAVTAGGGQSKAQAQAQINNLQRESYAKQADMAVIQQAVQGRYDSAKAIADRAVSAQLERETNRLNLLRFNYEENKDLYTVAEQRAFESAQADRENKLAQEREDKLAIKQFALSALQAGASTAEVQQAMGSKTLDEAIGLVGSYLRPKPAAVGSSKPSITEIDGKPYVWDEATGQYIPAGEYIKGGGMDTEQNQQLTQTLSLARELKNPATAGKGSAVGASLAKFVPFGQSLGLQGKRTAFENKVNTLKANLTLENLGLLKGPMSDKDLAFLQAVGSSLTTDMSEAEFDKELTKVIKKLETAQGKTPNTFQVDPNALPFAPQDVLRLPDSAITAPNGDQVIIVD